MLSLYRRHRPKTFDEVVGQESVVRTLRNAIDLGKVHHAYLFVGSRGTGKTSMAKLLACALNAQGGARVDFDPGAPAARAIMSGTSLDVVEMDAASNNSVDDIRDLRENVAMSPMGGARRVYILDEAHMLSAAAWNAFLKTLEEPPPHVVFVLATTEAHKVPATIVDRCHRFDFQRPSLEQIADVLRRVADQEEISIPDPAVGMIARKAAGSFRDALGTLEQLVTYGGSELALEDVMATLGVADAELILDVSETLIDRDPRGALLAVQRLTASGRDESRFMRDLAAHLRHLYVVQTMGDVPDSFAVTAGHTDRLADQAARLPQAEILRAIDLLATALASVKDGAEPRLALEVALLKATQPQVDQSLQALMQRLDRIEAGIGGPSPAAAPVPPQPPAPDPSPAPSYRPPESERPAVSEPVAPPEAPAAEQSVVEPPAVAEPVAPPERPLPEPPAAEPPKFEPSAVAEPVAPPEPPRAEPPRAEPPPAAEPPPPERPPVAVGDAPVPVQPPAPAPQAGSSDLDLERIRSLWGAVTDAVQVENAMVGALIVDARPVRLEEGLLTVHFPSNAAFSKKKAEANRGLIAEALRGLSGHHVQVTFELGDQPADSGPTVLSEDEFAERLKRDYGAEEIFEADPDPVAEPAAGSGPDPVEGSGSTDGDPRPGSEELED